MRNRYSGIILLLVVPAIAYCIISFAMASATIAPASVPGAPDLPGQPPGTPPPLPTLPPIDLIVDGSGVVQADVNYSADDGNLYVTIPSGTVAQTGTGDPLDTIEVGLACFGYPAPPPNSHVIGCAYDFQPDGSTFAPPITLTIVYDPGIIPGGIAEGDLVIANYDGTAEQWVELASTVNTISNTVSAGVNGFSMFAAYGTEPGSSLTTSATAGGNVATPGEGPFGYPAGTAAELVAVPEPGYCFVKWTGDVATVAAIWSTGTTITMSGNYSVTASFSEQAPIWDVFAVISAYSSADTAIWNIFRLIQCYAG